MWKGKSPSFISNRRTLGALLTCAVLFSGAEGALAASYGGYSKNAGSPVVGGWSVYKTSAGTHLFRPFGDVKITNSSKNKNIGKGTYAGGRSISRLFACPRNTAEIRMPEGYNANNGTLYQKVYWPGKKKWYKGDTYVCVKSDTY